MHLGRLAARAVIGSLFIGHGAQKLFGSFGGPGIEGTSGFMASLAMHPAKRNAYAAGLSETAGGALLLAGLATPVAAASLIGTMTTAIRKVHLSNGPWVSNGGYEYNLVLMAAVAALAEDPGDLSLDAALGLRDRGTGWAITAVVAGVVASTIAIEAGRRATPDGAGAGAAEPVVAEPDQAGDPVTED